MSGTKNYITLFIIGIMLSSCAYFNMFFNAKQSFDEAEEQYRKDGTISSDYKEAITELSKILEFYPENDLVDDALFLMGKCYFRQKQYSKAARKFQELEANYPKSELLNEAKIYLAQIQIAMGKTEEAEIIIKYLDESGLDTDGYEISLALGNMNLEIGDTVRAISYLDKAVNEVDDDFEKIRLLNKLKDIYKLQKNYSKASSLSEILISLYQKREDIFHEKLDLANLRFLQGKKQESFNILANLDETNEYSTFAYKARVAEALLKQKSGEIKEADSLFTEFFTIYAKDKSKSSYLTIAGSYMADSFLRVDQDLEKCSQMVDTALSYGKIPESKKTNYAFEDMIQELGSTRWSYLNEKKNQFNELKTSKDFLENFPSLLDSLNDITTIAQKDTSLTVKERKQLYRFKLKDLENKYNYHVYNCFELYLDDFNVINEAEELYSKIENDTTLTKVNHKRISLLMKKEISDPKMLNAVGFSLETDSLKYWFEQGSLSVVDSNYVAADKYFTFILRSDYYSEEASDILLSVAKFYEYHLVDLKKAKDAYEKINLYFPSGNKGLVAQRKLAFSKEEIKKYQDMNSKTDDNSDIWYLMDRRNID